MVKLIVIKGSPKVTDLVEYLAKNGVNAKPEILGPDEPVDGTRTLILDGISEDPTDVADLIAKHTNTYKNKVLISDTPRVGLQITFALDVDGDMIYVMTDEKGHGVKMKKPSALAKIMKPKVKAAKIKKPVATKKAAPKTKKKVKK